ncbi:tumor suppressor, Mitostatin-domain-containing protein [Ochromonadaceae sp. CCMP2298]|nr:tumor suppressor, Mitostatin-domain-containing protein [Ochromonadaceae sp. CCMP2298]|mmetsp:Transcript_10817/g.23959  ORF Transcript_10817/g.23959 Transcript_10817/m.23959 type:complete len:487 (+) Transcript_10817:126-1586(+)
MSTYRAIGSTSSIDESLFGKGGGSLTTTRRKVTGPLGPSSVVISADELMRIKYGSVIKSEAEIQADREYAERMKEEKDKLSKDRKDRMKVLEKRSQLLAKKSDVEVAEAAKKNAIRSQAEKKLDSNSDVVKLLNSMAQRAIAFTIRDQQLEEKDRLAAIEKEFDSRMDVVIEIDRLKDIKQREEESKFKQTKRVEDRKTINEQIAGRQRQRMLQLEAREQENQAMRGLMKKYESEDAITAANKAVVMEKSRAAVLLANDQAIQRKKAARDLEKKEMDDILVYQALKDQELSRRDEEEAAVMRTKKERQAKLLAQQEKAQNSQGKMDELRARRAAEEKERNERRREKADAIKRKESMNELLESRAKQAADKVERMKAHKKEADEAILNNFEYTKRMDEREADERRKKEHLTNDHKTRLQAQIEERERARRNENVIDVGSNLRQELIVEEAKLATIRDLMVKDLITQGINPRYLGEIRNMDIGKILKR